MDDFFAFLLAHWMLSAGFVAVLVAFLVHELLQVRSGAPFLSPHEMIQWVNHDAAQVLDVREAASFERGHVVGAINIPWSQWTQHTSVLKDDRRPCVVVCDQGVFSAKAAKHLKRQGFLRVGVLSGGMRLWLADHLPVVKS